jgi:hypothetical protein
MYLPVQDLADRRKDPSALQNVNKSHELTSVAAVIASDAATRRGATIIKPFAARQVVQTTNHQTTQNNNNAEVISV